MPIVLPGQGLVFWPVGSGDCTTIVVNKNIVLQVDIRHLAAADNDDDHRIPVIDHLVELLPKKDGKPYLAVFALTHPDEDHCCGFPDLLKAATIGELWFTPRVFREYKKDLSEDAQAFRAEAMRRVKKTIKGGGKVGSCDRCRVIGYDDLLSEDDFNGFPKEQLSVPGQAIGTLDGVSCDSQFRAFVHAPFKDDSDGDRNDTSLGLQVTLANGSAAGRVLLLGDLRYPTIQRIFKRSQASDLAWNVFLAPHHCSKSVMYWQDEGTEEESLKQDILDAIEDAAELPGCIVASSEPVPESNEAGDNPPHALAKARYQEIAPGGFLCTQEHPSEESPQPIVFALGEDGFEYVQLDKRAEQAGRGIEKGRTLASAVTAARGTGEPPGERVGFGVR